MRIVPEMRVPLFAAYTFIEALNDAEEQQALYWNARRTRPVADNELGLDRTAQAEEFDVLRRRLFALVYGLWLPRLMTTKTVDEVNDALEFRPLTLKCNPFSRSADQFCVGRTAGHTGGLRDEIMDSYGKRYSSPSKPMEIELFKAICEEAVVDWVINSTRSNYEVRKCAWCGLWFEPKLGGRSRFCDSRCRQEFNNARVGKDTGQFHCYRCRDDRPIEEFSGLGLTDNPAEEHDTRSTPLFFKSIKAAEGIYGGDSTCVGCIRQYYPEWSRYIAPIASRSPKRARL